MAHVGRRRGLRGSWLSRLPRLGARPCGGHRPVSIDGRRLEPGVPLGPPPTASCRCAASSFCPIEPGAGKRAGSTGATPTFPAFHAGALSFGLNICTELWALETYGAYAAPASRPFCRPERRPATTAKWLAVGVVAPVRSGAFSLSSNRWTPTGACGGAGWIISPDGEILATTTRDVPFVTIDLDLTVPIAARASYPRYVFD